MFNTGPVFALSVDQEMTSCHTSPSAEEHPSVLFVVDQDGSMLASPLYHSVFLVIYSGLCCLFRNDK